MNLNEIKDKCLLFERIKSITLETSLENKRRIVEENKNKKALIETSDNPGKYALGILVTKNDKYMGLESIEKKRDNLVACLIEYKELSGLFICSD